MNQLQAFAVAALIFLMPGFVRSQSQEQPRTISTTGEAALYVQPDEAVLNFGVVSIARELDEAKAENDERSKQLTDAVKGLGIDPKHVATDQVGVDLIYEDTHHQSQRTTISAYRVTRSYMVTLKDLSQLEAAVNTVLKSGANVFEGVSFCTSELRKHRDNARTMAIKAAKEKADALAGALSAKVGDPRTITESRSYAGMWHSGGRREAAMYQNVAQEVPAEPVAEAENMPLGQIAIEASVSVTFDLLPGQP